MANVIDSKLLHFLCILSLHILIADFVESLKTFDQDSSNVRNFRHDLGETRRLLGRVARDLVMHDSVLCIRLGGAFDEKIKEEKLKTNKTTFANEVHLTGDNKASLQLAWTGVDYDRIMLVTGEDGTSTIYLSDESGINFINITHRVEESNRAEITLQKHTNDSKIVYLIANSLDDSKSKLYVSTDGANNFKKVDLEFKLESNIIFHAEKVNLLLAVDEYIKDLYLSQDSGLTWQKIKSNVVLVKWGTGEFTSNIFVATNNDTKSIFFPMFSDSQNNVLEKSPDLGKSWKKLYDRVYTFGMGGKFIYASIYNDKTSSSERSLVISSDGGNIWNHARLPTITPDRFYSILDSSEGQIFIHVDHPGDTGRGTLYTSDATGIIFSESLENHLYPNFEDLTDFYRVLSMRCVYIASQLLSDDSIHTMITFDCGGEWQPIKRPEGTPCHNEAKECYLQIHNLYSMKRGVSANPPMSVSNAIGIILVHGHVADALQTTDPDVFCSSDGGYNWRLSLEGPHHYQIADHGGLLVAVPADTETPNVVRFSTDEGRCWISYNFTEKQIVFTGLLIEPGNRDMSVAIWGYTRDDRIWHTHIINFTKVIDKQCESSDYEDWIPHLHNGVDGCILGTKETFRKLKADSWCYNGRTYEVKKTSEACLCTTDDFDCDYGYIRQMDKCIKDTTVDVKEIDICLNGHEESIVPLGYHKIPGDRCSGGFVPHEAKMIDLNEMCSSDPQVFVAHVVDQVMQSHGGRMRVIIVSTIAIISIAFAIVVVTVLGKKYKKYRRPTYRYSSIKCDDEEGDPISGIINTHTNTSLFEDSSDEDLPRPTVLKNHVSRSNGNVITNGHIPNNVNKDSGLTKQTKDSDDELLD